MLLLFVFATMLFIFGYIYITNPARGWYLHEGWRYRDKSVQPNEVTLGLYRGVGAVMMMAGAGLVIVFILILVHG